MRVYYESSTSLISTISVVMNKVFTGGLKNIMSGSTRKIRDLVFSYWEGFFVFKKFLTRDLFKIVSINTTRTRGHTDFSEFKCVLYEKVCIKTLISTSYRNVNLINHVEMMLILFSACTKPP